MTDVPTDFNAPSKPYRILSLDGGGAKGFYTLGALREIEALANRPLYEAFDMIFGTSTGAIIAALLALGKSVDEIHALYKQYVPKIMSCWTRAGRTEALQTLARNVFGDAAFTDVKTRVGIVAVKYRSERPMIFKAHADQAHGMRATFRPGYGVSIADAVQASCSAYPFFERKTVTTSNSGTVELIDGGFCANNPTLYAIAEALAGLKLPRGALRVVSVGVGVYPQRKRLSLKLAKLCPFNSIALLQKTLEINTQSMDQLREILFGDVDTVRINETFERPELATDLMEHDLDKLNLLHQEGRQTFARNERKLMEYFDDGTSSPPATLPRQEDWR
jgi:patatin-like phospholipase/acyl hydrolase